MKICLNSLRLRLGWSRHELIRLIGCTPQDFERWVKAKQVPELVYNRWIAPLTEKMDAHTQRISRDPVADLLLEDGTLNQIEWQKLERKAA
jgi:hypothetical protein